MTSKFSILHISDLHRITDADIDCIISSFELEKEEYKKLQIPPVKLIIVSGDIINGSKRKNKADAKKEIQQQYKTAKRFLVALTESFLGAEVTDRLNVIIVPGNHDMSRYVSEASMKPIGHDDIDKLVSALWSDNSMIRWSWKTLQFCEIKKKDIYNQRFDDFIEFYNSFYQNMRIYPTDVDALSDLIDIPELNMSVACFNSCYQLDHLRLSGYISPKSLSKLTKPLIEAKNKGRFVVAVWHHHTRGLPKENNYLDYTILDNMKQNGIHLAFHGHQHVSGIVNERKDIFSDSKLTMVSAGTLYGNSNDLPLGVTRQYNIVSVDMNKEKCNLTLFSREDKTFLNIMPAWDKGFIGRSEQLCYDFSIDMPQCSEKHPEDNLQNDINDINMFIEKSNDFQEGINRLKRLGTDIPLVRKFLLEVVLRTNDMCQIKSLFSDPQTIEEAITVIDACTRSKDAETFHNVLNSDFVSKSKDVSLRAVIEDAKIQLKHIIH